MYSVDYIVSCLSDQLVVISKANPSSTILTNSLQKCNLLSSVCGHQLNDEFLEMLKCICCFNRNTFVVLNYIKEAKTAKLSCYYVI